MTPNLSLVSLGPGPCTTSPPADALLRHPGTHYLKHLRTPQPRAHSIFLTGMLMFFVFAADTLARYCCVCFFVLLFFLVLFAFVLLVSTPCQHFKALLFTIRRFFGHSPSILLLFLVASWSSCSALQESQYCYVFLTFSAGCAPDVASRLLSVICCCFSFSLPSSNFQLPSSSSASSFNF